MRRFPLLLAVFSLLLALPSGASAAVNNGLIKDCADDGRIDGSYSRGDLRDTLDGLPVDVEEYTNCRAAINGRINQTGGGDRRPRSRGEGDTFNNNGSEPGFPNASQADDPINYGGSTPSGGSEENIGGTPTLTGNNFNPDAIAADQRAAIKAAQEAAPTASIAGRSITPGEIGLEPTSQTNDLPTPLLVVLILIGAGALFAIASTVRSRVLGRRTA